MNNFYTRIISGAVFPLQERLKRHTTVAVRQHLEQTQWWNIEKIRQYQIERLRFLLGEAQHHVPYYQRLFKELNFDPLSVNSLADLARLPFLTKAVIRANFEELKADNARGLAKSNTGGSSGEPLVFLIGLERVSHDVAAKWRATRWWSVDIGDPEVVVWGSPIELGSQDRVRRLRDKLMRSQLLPAFEMSPENLDKFLEKIRTMRPKMLFGYPAALAHVARHAQQRGVDMTDLGIKVAFVTSEVLYPHQRSQIEQTFACRVANGYGGRDAGFIAHECPAGNMHITAEDIIVEIIDPNGNVLPAGESGEIVVTHLATRDYPFIRYRTGDIGVLDDKACSCGRGLPLLKEIKGRSQDFMVAQNGTIMDGGALTYVVRDVNGINAFKIVQETIDFTQVYLAVDDQFDQACLEKIVAGLKRRLGETVEIKIHLVDEIPREASGKFRYLVSKVVGNYWRQ